jgi:hypothetical protein
MTDERRDDEILGRALARAIETINVNETPYERSRLASPPSARRLFPLWQVAGGAAALVLAVALGTWLNDLREARQGPAVSSPGVTAPSSTPAVTSSPVAVDPNRDRIWLYFARDQLPPVGANVGYAEGAAGSGISSRISALRNSVEANEIPPGATNPFAKVAPSVGGTSTLGISVRVQGDLATVEFDIPTGWGVRGSAESLALLQQLVYTITEEPGIRRALVTEKGKPNAVIDQLVVDRPLAREDVFGYGTTSTAQSIEDDGDDTVADLVDWRASVDDVSPGLGRFVVELAPTSSAAPQPMPKFTARLERPTQEKRTDDGKWVLRVELPDAVWQQSQGEAFHCCPLKAVGKTPIREVAAYPLNTTPLPGPGTRGGGAYRGVGFAVVLDDARPWRVSVLHNPLRLVVDVGGTPRAVSDSVAVYAPRPGDTGRTVTISGFARSFEAHVAWRIKDSRDRIVAEGFTIASIGTSPVWGSFQTNATIPATVSGNVTLEVFWASPRDGADVGLVQIPLTVR